MGLNYMQSERSYNRGSSEYQCEAEITLRAYPNGPLIDFGVIVMYEVDGQVKVTAAFQDNEEAGEDEVDLTIDQYDECLQAAISDYEYRCERAQDYEGS